MRWSNCSNCSGQVFETTSVGLYATQFILCLVNVILHSIGSSLLYILQKRNRDATQLILIMHLSLSELMWSALAFVKTCINLFDGVKPIVTEYLTIIELTGVMWIYLISMILVTLDRFFHFYFLLKYNTIFTKRRAMWLCNILWFIGVVSCTAVGAVYYQEPFEYLDYFYKYIYPPLEFTFLFSAIITYSYILYTYRKNALARKSKKMEPRRKSRGIGVSNKVVPLDGEASSSKKDNGDGRAYCVGHSTSPPEKVPERAKVRKPTLLIPSMIMMTFLVFIMIPDLTYMTIVYIQKKETTEVYNTVTWIMYMTGVPSDSVIYIFLQKTVRRELFRRLRLRRQHDVGNNSITINTVTNAYKL